VAKIGSQISNISKLTGYRGSNNEGFMIAAASCCT